MHATPQEIAAPFAADIPQYQRNALQTIHKIMLHLTEGLTKPPEEDTPQSKTATQRIRLALQAARDLLRFNPSGEPTRTPRPRSSSSNGPATTSRSSEAQTANKLLAAAGAEASRFGEGARIDLPPDSALITHDSPRDSSLVAHTSPSLPSSMPSVSSVFQPSEPSPGSSPPTTQAAPTPPEPLTRDELDLLAQAQKAGRKYIPFQIINRLREWQRYADATGTKPPFNIPRESLTLRKPSRREDDEPS